MGSKVVGFRVPDDLAEEVERVAVENGQTTAEFLRKLVDEALYPSKGGEKAKLSEKGKTDDSDGLDDLWAAVENLAEILNKLTSRIDSADGVMEKMGFVDVLRERVQSLEDSRYEVNKVLASNREFDDQRWSSLHLCPDCGRSLHMHLLDGGSWHLECVHCGYCSVDYKAPAWKETRGALFASKQGVKE